MFLILSLTEAPAIMPLSSFGSVGLSPGSTCSSHFARSNGTISVDLLRGGRLLAVEPPAQGKLRPLHQMGAARLVEIVRGARGVGNG